MIFLKKTLSVILIAIIAIIDVKLIVDYEINRPAQKYTLTTQKKTVAQIINFDEVHPEKPIEIENKEENVKDENNQQDVEQIIATENKDKDKILKTETEPKEKDSTESDVANFDALANALSDDTIISSVNTYQLIEPIQDTSESNITADTVAESTANTDLESNTQEASNSEAEGLDIVDTAKSYIGTNYVSGGTSPETGFDCSGFTQYIYGLYGIRLNRVASAQADNGTEISKDELQPGDLVLFSYYGSDSIGHAGIYVGDGNFVHAANSSRGVVEDTLESGYYLDNYVTARRVY